MSAPAFTPGPWDLGPWEQSRRLIITPSGEFMQARVIAHVFGGNIADDRLIAASPELYEALEELVSFLRAHVEHFKSYNPLTEDALAALAKARGETL